MEVMTNLAPNEILTVTEGKGVTNRSPLTRR